MHRSDNYTITENPPTDKWREFVHGHSEGSAFQLPEFSMLYANLAGYQPGVLALINEDGNIIALCAYVVMEVPGWRGDFSRRCIVTGGPLIHPQHKTVLTLLLTEWKKAIARYKVIYCQIRNMHPPDSCSQKSFTSNGWEYNVHLDIHIDLRCNDDTLWRNMHKMRRGNIKRSIKKGVTVEHAVPDDLGVVADLIKKTYKRINVPKPPRELFLALAPLLGKSVVILVAKLNETPIACRVYLLYNQVMYDWYAGSDENYFSYHPNDLLPWKAMKWGKEHGFEKYDFGGAGQPGKAYGVRDYKQRFGGELLHTGRFLLINRPLRYWLGKLAISVNKWKKII